MYVNYNQNTILEVLKITLIQKQVLVDSNLPEFCFKNDSLFGNVKLKPLILQF